MTVTLAASSLTSIEDYLQASAVDLNPLRQRQSDLRTEIASLEALHEEKLKQENSAVAAYEAAQQGFEQQRAALQKAVDIAYGGMVMCAPWHSAAEKPCLSAEEMDPTSRYYNATKAGAHRDHDHATDALRALGYGPLQAGR